MLCLSRSLARRRMILPAGRGAIAGEIVDRCVVSGCGSVRDGLAPAGPVLGMFGDALIGCGHAQPEPGAHVRTCGVITS